MFCISRLIRVNSFDTTELLTIVFEGAEVLDGRVRLDGDKGVGVTGSLDCN